ncbi:MAG TPA: hypothetical protein VMG31_06020 [Verrucomicrobiae bacterium]|nr:hypothetical protein [Verrucomicrobiae bacterium]
MKRTCVQATLLAVIALLTTSCGTSDKIGSVSITATGASGGIVNLVGIGGTLQFHVTANYTSGKQIDETNFATYSVQPDPINNVDDTGTALPLPPLTVTMNKTGMMTAVDPAVCTWINLGTADQPSWFLTGDYMVVATYRGFQSQPIYVGVASAAANTGDGTCGPS